MTQTHAGRRFAVLVLFAVAMGWLEAVVVVYIRGLLGVAHGPRVLEPGEIARRFAELPWLLGTEQGREAATIVMLATVAWLAAPRARSRLGAFLVAFGAWDLAYYLALFALLRWPPSLATMDLLFLLPPGPWWYQPVWVPVVISCAMVLGGAWLFVGPEGHRHR
jgi:hypothetical protein